MLDYIAIQKELQSLEARNKESFPKFQLKAAKNYIRILPEFDEKGLFWFKILFHWQIFKYPVICNKAFEDECIICSEFDKLPVDKKKALWKLRAQGVYLMNIVDIKEAPNKVQVATFFSRIAMPVFSFASDKTLNLLDPDAGRSIVIDRTTKDVLVYPDTAGVVQIDKSLLKGLYKLDKLYTPLASETVPEVAEKLVQIFSSVTTPSDGATSKTQESIIADFMAKFPQKK